MNDVHPQMSTETALRLLHKRQRRRVLRRVAGATDGTTVDQLERSLDGPRSTSPDRSRGNDRRGLELHHVHLPMLREADVIEYDTERRLVYRGRAFDTVYALLETIDAHRVDAAELS